MAGIKEEAVRIVEGLADDATWDDLMYAIYVNARVDHGRRAVADGRVVSQQQARKRAAKK
jgi:hypothetical protein